MGLCLCLAGLAGLYGREIHRRGWEAVPSSILVLVPFNERQLLDSDTVTGPDWVKQSAQELLGRAPDMGGWAGDRWAARVAARYRQDGVPGIDARSRVAYSKLASTPFVAPTDPVTLAGAVAAVRKVSGVEITFEALADAGPQLDPARSVTFPADIATCEEALNSLVVRSDGGWQTVDWTLRDDVVVLSTLDRVYTPAHVEVFALPSFARESPLAWVSGDGCFDNRPPGWYEAVPLSERSQFILDIVIQTVAVDSWQDNGGDWASIRQVGTSLLISTNQRDLLRIERLLGELQVAPGYTGRTSGIAVECIESDGSSTSIRAIVHDVTWLRDVSVSTAPDEWLPIDEIWYSLSDAIISSCEFDAWRDNGGDIASVVGGMDRFVVTAPDSIQKQVAALIPAVRLANEPRPTTTRADGYAILPLFDGAPPHDTQLWFDWLWDNIDRGSEDLASQYGQPTRVGNALVVPGPASRQQAVQAVIDELRARFGRAPP